MPSKPIINIVFEYNLIRCENAEKIFIFVLFCGYLAVNGVTIIQGSSSGRPLDYIERMSFVCIFSL